MQDSDDIPYDVPVADAVEQQRPPSEPALDEEASVDAPEVPPLEVSPLDWHEQQEEVDLAPDEIEGE